MPRYHLVIVSPSLMIPEPEGNIFPDDAPARERAMGIARQCSPMGTTGAGQPFKSSRTGRRLRPSRFLIALCRFTGLASDRIAPLKVSRFMRPRTRGAVSPVLGGLQRFPCLVFGRELRRHLLARPSVPHGRFTCEAIAERRISTEFFRQVQWAFFLPVLDMRD
jgi:hypothetical protein